MDGEGKIMIQVIEVSSPWKPGKKKGKNNTKQSKNKVNKAQWEEAFERAKIQNKSRLI